jgi:membrane-associated phospholipid phosphatase
MKKWIKQFNFDVNKHRWFIIPALIFWLSVTYMLPNKIVLRDPVPVRGTRIDELITLSTNWVWPYVSYYIYIFGMFLALRTDKFKKVLILAYTTAGFVSTLIFFTFPTMIFRDEFYPLSHVTGISEWALQFIRSTDRSINCMPSMHVALSLIATLTLSMEQKKWRPLAIVWFSLIAYSTMATKQHYFYDVVSGSMHGLIFWYVSYRYILNQNENISAKS